MRGNLIEHLYLTSNLNLFLIISSILIIISIAALFLIKWFIPLHFRYQENAVIACTSAFIIVIYGVLAGFATLTLINNESEATYSLQREASSVANLYRDSNALNKSIKEPIQKDIKNYISEVLHVEWPLMNQDKIVKSNADSYLQNLTQLLAQYKEISQGEILIVRDMTTQLSNLYDARQERIQWSYVSLSTAIWVAIIIGTVLALLISYIFGVNFYLHIFIVFAAALMTSTVLFLLISLDKPFAGTPDISPDTMINVSRIMNQP